jgi:NADH dehydrogenase (ubiquinone) flavoprotein 1
MKDYQEKEGGAAFAGGWEHGALKQGKLIAPGQ